MQGDTKCPQAYVCVFVSLFLPLMRCPTAAAISKRCFLYDGDVSETILATKKTRASETLEETVHTDTHTHTHTHHINQVLIVWCGEAGAAPLPLQYVISCAICMYETQRWGQHRRSTAVHPHLHSNHYFGLFIALFHCSSALFPGKCSPRLSHQLQTALFPLQWQATSLSSLCGIHPLKCQFAAAVASLRHLLPFSAPSITFSCIRWFHIFLCLCPVRLSFCLSASLSLGVSVIISFTLSPPPSLWAPGRSVGLSEEKYRFKWRAC